MKKCLLLFASSCIACSAWGDDCRIFDAKFGVCLDRCPSCECSVPSDVARGNYAGFRIYKNAHASYKYTSDDGADHRHSDDGFGFGTTLGNNLTDYLRVEYETLYMGAQYKTDDTDFNYDLWANFLNAYLLYDIDGAVAPYIGAGIGLTGIWGEVDNNLDNAFDVSYQALIGMLFRLNPRIDLEIGFKYVNYGKVAQKHGTSRVDATQFYVGAAYKFGI